MEYIFQTTYRFLVDQGGMRLFYVIPTSFVEATPVKKQVLCIRPMKSGAAQRNRYWRRKLVLYIVYRTLWTKQCRTEEHDEVEEVVIEARREEEEVEGQFILLPPKCNMEEKKEWSMLWVPAFKETIQCNLNPSPLKEWIWNKHSKDVSNNAKRKNEMKT